MKLKDRLKIIAYYEITNELDRTVFKNAKPKLLKHMMTNFFGPSSQRIINGYLREKNKIKVEMCKIMEKEWDDLPKNTKIGGK